MCIALLLPLLVSTVQAQTYSPSDITDLILITGQSNVQGSKTDTDPIEDAVHPRVFAYTLDPFSRTEDWQVADLRQAWDVNGWHPGNGTLQCEADPATCSSPPNTPYNNFAFHFAKTVADADPDRVVGIIVASAPGEGIQHWDAGGEFQQIIGNKVSAALNAQGVKTKLDAILWHQGETDWLIEGTSDPDASDNEKTEKNYYPRKLSELITNFRTQQWFDGQRPFICGETKAAPVNAHLMALNTDGDNWSGCVIGNDLTTRDERTHFDAEALRAIGERYGVKHLEMTAISSPEPDDVPPDTVIEGTITTENGTTIFGYATDEGANGASGSGFSNVRLALKDTISNNWFNFNTSQFTEKFEVTHATLEHATDGQTEWIQATDLLPGSYKAFAIATDSEGNYKRTGTGGRLYSTYRFQIEPDTPPPSIEIETPTETASIAGDVHFAGYATAFNNTQISQVRVAITDLDSRYWYDDSTGSFSSGFKHTVATVADGVDGIYGWSYSLPLPPGTYKFFANPIDSTGNFPTHINNSSREYKTVRFTVNSDVPDNHAPATMIDTPSSNTAEDLVLGGSASDTGGSGLAYIRIALKNTLENTWYDFAEKEFVEAFRHGRANMMLSDQDNATWTFSPDLTEGRYKLFALAEDYSGNYTTTGSGFRLYETMGFILE